MQHQNLIACHACDLLQRRVALPVGASARCPRCGEVLYRNRPNSIERTLAFALAGVVLFLVANTFPFLSLEIQGQVTRTTLWSGTKELYDHGRPLVAILVGITTIVAPALQLLGLLYVLVPIKFGRTPRHLATVMRTLESWHPWAMMEIFMLGILVAMVKLASMAEIVLGTAIWAFAVLIVVLAAAMSSFEPDLAWQRLELSS